MYLFSVETKAPQDQVVCGFLTDQVGQLGQKMLTVVPPPQHSYETNKNQRTRSM